MPLAAVPRLRSPLPSGGGGAGGGGRPSQRLAIVREASARRVPLPPTPSPPEGRGEQESVAASREGASGSTSHPVSRRPSQQQGGDCRRHADPRDGDKLRV